MASDPIETVLGRPLIESERASVRHLNEFPPDLLSQVRNVANKSSSLAMSFIRFLVDPSSHPWVDRFVEEVVYGTKDAATWRRSDVLWCIGSDSPEDLLCRPLAELLGPLSAVAGERWYRVAPRVEQWDYSVFCGAPGVLVRDSDYRSRQHAHCQGLRLAKEPIEIVDDLKIAGRRWLASRITWLLRAKSPTLVVSPGAVRDVTGVVPERWSRDAEAAIRGVSAAGDAGLESLAPGFGGADDLYQDRSQ